jgi:hypothetical protein
MYFPTGNNSAMRTKLAILILLFGLLPNVSHAYIGPGLGAGTIGVILGVLVSVLLALFAIFWYPIKRLFKGKKAKSDTDEGK